MGKAKREAEFSVSLWGKAKQQIQDLKLWKKYSAQVVIVTSLATKQFDGEIHGASMSPIKVLSPTKVYVNLDIPEVKQYLDRFSSFNIQPQLLTRKFEVAEETPETAPSIKSTISDLIQTTVLEVEPGQRFQVEADVVSLDITSIFPLSFDIYFPLQASQNPYLLSSETCNIKPGNLLFDHGGLVHVRCIITEYRRRRQGRVLGLESSGDLISGSNSVLGSDAEDSQDYAKEQFRIVFFSFVFQS